MVLGVACLAVAFGAPLPYLTQSMEQMAAAGTGLGRHYATQPASIQTALIVHAGTGGLALALTPLQLSSRFRRRFPAWHRVVGRISVAAIAVAAVFGLVVAQVSYAGLSGRIGFSTLAVVWAWSAFQTVRAARTGRLDDHRRWALRTAALTMAAVTLRVVLMFGFLAQVGLSDTPTQLAFDRAYVVTPFLSWLPNLALVEWLLRRRPALGI